MTATSEAVGASDGTDPEPCTLVTGATGLLGNNVVRALLQRGERVRALVREGCDPRPLKGLDVEIATGDVRDAASVRRAASGVGAIIHSAAWINIGWTKLELAREINVQGTCNVADAARDERVKLVHVSTVDTLAPGQADQPADEETPGEKPRCCYTISKREAEEEVLARVPNGLKAVVVNPGFMLGPWDWKPSSGRMMLEVSGRVTPLAPPGGISICDARDVAAAILNARDRGRVGERYILAGENILYLDLWRRFARLSGRRGPVGRLSPLIGWAAGFSGDVWAHLSGSDPDINSAAIAMGKIFHYYTSARAFEELGYQSRPVDESIQDAWEWFVDEGFTKRPSTSRPARPK